jgi:hypothetical protein
MPRVKHYFPVSHEINDDPEVWELTSIFGDRAFRTWMEVLRILDRTENHWLATAEGIEMLSRKVRQRLGTVQKQVSWMLTKGWLSTYEPPANGLPVVYYSRKYWDFHRSPEHKGTKPGTDSVPSLTYTLPHTHTKPKEKREIKPPSPEAIELAQLLSDKIFENFPNRTAPTEATLTAWAHDAERIHSLDGHSWQDIRSLLEWSQCDDFWKQNILSMRKFREKWNQLIARRDSQLTSGGGSSKISELRSRTAAMLKRGLE